MEFKALFCIHDSIHKPVTLPVNLMKPVSNRHASWLSQQRDAMPRMALPRHFLWTSYLQCLACWNPVGCCITTVRVSVRVISVSKPPYHDEVETPSVIIKCVPGIKISYVYWTVHHLDS